MQVKTFSKWLVRSRSPRFVMDRFGKARPDVLRRYSWNGIELHYRPGTSDQGHPRGRKRYRAAHRGPGARGALDDARGRPRFLTSLGKEFLENVKWIYGELHGNRDFELLAFLSDQFDIGVKRTMGKRLFMFQARNKSVQAR